MGTTLEAAVTSTRRLRRSSLRLADRAARRCLTRGGHASSELDMLLNAGLYREDGLGEPALAALIQEDIGANPRQPPAAGHGTFSLDIANGACGVLTAVYLLDGFMRSQVIHLGMVVTSDVAPSGARGYGFPSVGGALLLGWDDATPGFTAFQFETFPEYAGLFESRAHWEQKGEHAFPTRRRGRNRGPSVPRPGAPHDRGPRSRRDERSRSGLWRRAGGPAWRSEPSTGASSPSGATGTHRRAPRGPGRRSGQWPTRGGSHRALRNRRRRHHHRACSLSPIGVLGTG